MLYVLTCSVWSYVRTLSDTCTENIDFCWRFQISNVSRLKHWSIYTVHTFFNAEMSLKTETKWKTATGKVKRLQFWIKKKDLTGLFMTICNISMIFPTLAYFLLAKHLILMLVLNLFTYLMLTAIGEMLWTYSRSVFILHVFWESAVSFVATRGSKPETCHVLLHALLNNANF